MTGSRHRRSLLAHPTRYVVAGFLAVIAVGTAVLLLPWSTQPGQETTLLQAAFTTTSAVCVTGLVVVDTGTHWSGFGQGAILVLVQVGGLGFMTVSSLLLLLVSRRLGLRRRLVTNAERESLSLGDLREVLVGVAIITVTVQLVVALVLAVQFAVRHGMAAGTATWNGVFHSVTAFNNAGFSLFSDSLVGFRSDWAVLVPIMMALTIGGLGFPVLVDLRRVGGRWAHLSLHSKVTLTATGGLLVLGVALLSALEWRNPATLGPMPVGEKLLNGTFAGVTPRTAGFNSIDVSAMHPTSLLVTIALMFVGAGSAGTSGGIKVSTFAILVLVIWSQLRGDGDVNGFHRRIPGTTQRRALTVVVLAITLVVTATGILLLSAEAELGDALFEAVSAFGTAGMSTGLTPELPAIDQIVVMALMLIGRVGPVTLGAALVLRARPSRYRLPEEGPLIG